jgi:hypothetical protein
MTVILEQQAAGRYDIATLLSAIDGKNLELPRGYAMSLLLGTQYPAAHRALEAIVENRLEPPEIRAIAVRHLGLLPPCQVQEILTRNLISSQDDRVALEIVRVLGRIGDGGALAAVEKVRGTARGPLARVADFAALLIAYRSGCDGPSCHLPDPVEAVPLPAGCLARARHGAASPREYVACVAALGDEPLGIEYSPAGATRIDFTETRWMLLLNRAVVEAGLDRWLDSRRLVGVIAEHDVKDDSYYPLLLILATPSPHVRPVTMHLHDPDGELVYLGRGSVTPKGLSFALRTVSRTAMTLEASLVVLDGRCVAENISYSPRLPGRRVPARLSPWEFNRIDASSV